MTSVSHEQIIHSLRRAAILTIMAALMFWAFFQLSKLRVFAEVNPFAKDPIDAIGSIAFQVTVLVGILTLARAVGYRQNPQDLRKPHLIIRGCFIVLSAIILTLLADTSAEVQQPSWPLSIWGKLLVGGLGVVALWTLLAGFTLFQVVSQLGMLHLAQDEMTAADVGVLGEALDDLWTLLWVTPVWLSQTLPWLAMPVWWLESLHPKRIFTSIPGLAWVDPWSYPWRFCWLAGLAAGVGLALAHGLEDGVPTDIVKVLPVALLFIVIETMVTSLGFLTLGGFLGLRPPLKRHRLH